MLRRRSRPFPPASSSKPPGDLGRLSFSLDPWAISIAEGLRAAFATAPLVAANAWFHQPLLMQAALGALLSSYCDPGGPTKQRLRPLAIFGVLGAAVTFITGALAPWPGLAIPAAGGLLFLTSFARVYGLSAQSVGNLLGVVVALCMGRANLPDGDTGLGGWPDALAFLVGSLWTQAIALGVWRIRPFTPARRALAAVFDALAALSAGMRAALTGSQDDADNPAAPDWGTLARIRRSRTREAIERARRLLLDMRHRRGIGAERAGMLLIRLEAADQIFGALIGISDLLEEDDRAAPGRSDNAGVFLRRLRPVLAALARHMPRDTPLPERRLLRAADAPTRGRAEACGALATLENTIQERLRVIVTVQSSPAILPGAARQAEPYWDAVSAPLRANSSWSSAVLRHATRTALLATLAFAALSIDPAPYQHWLTITLIVTLQPHYAMTAQRAFERIAGTLAGGALAAALTLTVHGPLSIAAALFPLAILALSLRPASYALFIVFLTPMIVLLTQYEQGSGGSDLYIAAMRALFTILGGALALLGNLLLWPSWEPGRLRAALRQSLQDHARYAEAAFAALMGDATQEAASLARRQAGLASNNLEASLSRALLEPGRSAISEQVEPVMLIDTALRRIAGRLSVLHMAYMGEAERDALAAWRSWIADAFQQLLFWTDAPDAAHRSPRAPPRLPPRPEAQTGVLQDALQRIARQLELIAGMDMNGFTERRPALKGQQPNAADQGEGR